jgi:hypothetical protein
MSDVDLLRRAAALMRERANAARPSPWQTDVDEGHETRDVVTDARSVAVCQTINYGNGDGLQNARHIASWHPFMAHEIADWLDVVAHDVSRPGFDAGWMRVYDQAFTVAHAFLREHP